MIWKGFVTGLALCLFSQAHAFAGFYSGNEIYAKCTDNDTFYRGQCLSYIAGISDAMDENNVDGFTACIPGGVTAGQLKDLVTQWLFSHANKRHYAASGLVAHALSDNYPCR